MKTKTALRKIFTFLLITILIWVPFIAAVLCTMRYYIMYMAKDALEGIIACSTFGVVITSILGFILYNPYEKCIDYITNMEIKRMRSKRRNLVPEIQIIDLDE